ncbi:MAG: DUF1398 family protein [Chloroflexi bacterium]|nr:DUF1398 family protein [Chloroflexota bacterium]OJW06282.1 MAG: hypothetical protein BGO39_25960 [Chloroflexi bacterium 54-19]
MNITNNAFEAVLTEVRSQSKDYPHYADNLKKTGVKWYGVKIATHEITYYGEGDVVIYVEKGSTSGMDAAQPGKPFNQEKIQAALIANQQGRTDFQQFLVDTLEAGVTHYTADLSSLEIDYRGANGESYIESIPAVA